MSARTSSVRLRCRLRYSRSVADEIAGHQRHGSRFRRVRGNCRPPPLACPRGRFGRCPARGGRRRSRRGLFHYLTVEESADYPAIMDLFSATLLTDLSATEVAAQLAERGLNLPRDTVEARCRQLVDWGNLVHSIRDARVATAGEYVRSRSRYQVSSSAGGCTAKRSPSCTPATGRGR